MLRSVCFPKEKTMYHEEHKSITKGLFVSIDRTSFATEGEKRAFSRAWRPHLERGV